MKIKMQDGMSQPSNPIKDTMRINSALRDRRIYLSDEVDRDTIFEVMYFMDRIKDIDDMEGEPIEDRMPIEIIENSYGGNCVDGLSLISKILSFRDLGYEIITTVSGVGFSMGFMIAIVGSRRQAYRYARLMLHQPSSASWGTLKDMVDNVEETKYIWDVMKEIVIDHTDITEDMLDLIYREKRDVYYNPQEAIELNIIDEII